MAEQFGIAIEQHLVEVDSECWIFSDATPVVGIISASN